MKLINLIPLKEIDFRNQDAFDAYQKQHQLRPDTKVTIAGKPTTAGQAAQQSKDKAVKGTSVFGKDKGGSVFGGDTSKAKQITNDDIEGLTSYKDFDKFFKANKDKLDKKYIDDIEGQIGALDYLESDYEAGDADREEVLIAYIDLQDLIKKAMPKEAPKADTPSKPKPKESTNWSFGALSGPAGWVAANAGTHAGLKPDLSYKDRDDFVGTWADENLIDLNKVADAISNKKLKFTDIATAANGNPGNKYTKDIASKYPLEPKDFEKYAKKAQPEKGSIESLTSYKDFANFYKTNKDKLDKNYVDDIKGQIGALKYLESDEKRGKVDWEEVLVAYEELQDLIKKALSKNDTPDIKGPKPNEKGWSTQDVFNATFKDPETGKTITVGDAYDREDDSPAYQKAFDYVSQFNPDDEKLIGEKINIKNEVVKLKNLLPKK